VFWDVEQFMWPNLLLLHPPLALGAMQYRADRVEAARNNSAVMTHTAGLKFPWESAFTGLASTVYDCQQNEFHEIHIDGDVSLAMWQTYQATRDKQWLAAVAWPVLQGVAEFWASRLTPGPGPESPGNISLLDAGGPDESNSHATDNSDCLASAHHSIRHA
jgi:trehalose/maltose hydrolase-like predicted phosphorylase